MSRLQWSPRALDDLDRIDDFNLVRGEAWAMRVQLRIGQRCESLVRSPFQGRPIRGTDKRRASVTDVQYVIDYRVVEDGVRILRVRHTREDRRD